MSGDVQGAKVSSMRILATLFVLLFATPAYALEVGGVAVSPEGGLYVVTKDVNVRAKPTVKAKKLGSAKKGTRLRLVGKPETKDWVAVEVEGIGQGFMIDSVLMPLLDGALEDPVLMPDYAAKAGPHCQIVVRYEGSTPVENDLFTTADYDVPMLCMDGTKRARFSNFMFMTESPYRMTPGGDFQIGFDIFRIKDDLDEPMAYTFLYRPADKKVIFDSVNYAEYVVEGHETERVVEDIPALLTAVVEMTVESWNDKAWEQVFKAEE